MVELDDLASQANEASYIMRVIADNQELARAGHPLPNDLVNWFEAFAYIGVRRQLDRDCRSCSLINVLEDMKTNESTLRKVIVKGRKTSLTLREVKKDLARLEISTEKVQSIVNKQIAHDDNIGYPGPTIWPCEMFGCIRIVHGLASKYLRLLCGSSVTMRKPSDDWWAIFRRPWLTRRGHPPKPKQPSESLAKHIARLEQRLTRLRSASLDEGARDYRGKN